MIIGLFVFCLWIFWLSFLDLGGVGASGHLRIWILWACYDLWIWWYLSIVAFSVFSLFYLHLNYFIRFSYIYEDNNLSICYKQALLIVICAIVLYAGVKRFAYISAADFGVANYLLKGYYEGKVLSFTLFR